MPSEAMQQTWETYTKAWADVSGETRSRLVIQAVAEDVVYTSPDAAGCGIRGLMAVLQEFQQKFPGAYFETNHLFAQHRRCLAEWTMRDSSHAQLLAGRTYARLNDQGLIKDLAGFWEL